MKCWEAVLFKVCTISLGIVVGATWADAFIHLLAVFLVVCILSAIYLTRVWWKQ